MQVVNAGRRPPQAARSVLRGHVMLRVGASCYLLGLPFTALCDV